MALLVFASRSRDRPDFNDRRDRSRIDQQQLAGMRESEKIQQTPKERLTFAAFCRLR